MQRGTMSQPEFKGPFQATAWKKGSGWLCRPHPRWARRFLDLREAQKWLERKAKEAKAEGGAVIRDLATHRFIWGIDPDTGKGAYQ